MFYVALIVTCFASEPEWPTVLWPSTLWPTELHVEEGDTSPFDEIREKGGEYAAPIPDSLVIVHELTRIDGSTLSIVLEKSVAEETLIRLGGPTHPYPHQGCLMCLGNHLIQTHGQSTNYLHSITYDQWKILHDNLHNGKDFIGVKGSGEGYIGYEAGGGSYRWGLFGRRRR